MRRLVAVLMAIVALAAAFEVSAPLPAAAQAGNEPVPYLRVDPDCIPGGGATTQIRARGSGFTPGTVVELRMGSTKASSISAGSLTAVKAPTIQTAQASQPAATARVSELGTFTVSFAFAAKAAVADYRVLATTRGGSAQASALVPSPCRASIAVTPKCTASDAGRSPKALTIRGSGFGTSRPRLRIWSVEPGAPEGQNIFAVVVVVRADGTFSTSVDIGRLSRGTYKVQALPTATGFTAVPKPFETWFEAPCPDLDIKLIPECAPAGAPQDRMRVRVRASGFHPRRQALVIWDAAPEREGRPRSFEVFPTRTDTDGAFVLDTLPYRRDNGGYSVRVRSEDNLGNVRQRTVSFRIPCPPVRAEIKATECGRPRIERESEFRWTVNVVGTGFRPGAVTVIFDADEILGRQAFQRTVDREGRLDEPIDPLAGPRGQYRIVVRQGAPSTGSLAGLQALSVITAETTFRVPCSPRTPPKPVVDQVCGPVAPGEVGAYEIMVSGGGFFRSRDDAVRPGVVRILFEGVSSPRVTQTRSADGTYRRRIVVDGLDEGVYTIRVVQRDVANNQLARTGRVAFTVPCPIDPHIEVVPDHGPAGYTALVEGEGFTPDSIATLTWDSGITAGQPTVVAVGPEGTFEVYLYILPNDWVGERSLVAGLPEAPEAFPDVTDVYVVVPGSGLPPGGAQGDQIVSRR